MTDEGFRFAGAQTISVHGDTERIEPVKGVRMTLTADWGFEAPTVNFRFTVTFDLYDTETSPEESGVDISEFMLAAINGAIVLRYITPVGMTEPENETWYQEFIKSRALPDVVPFVRELVTATANRLGFPNVTIDAMPANINQDIAAGMKPVHASEPE